MDFVGAKVFKGTWSLETLRSFDLAVSIDDLMLSISQCWTATFLKKANHSGGEYILAARSFIFLFQELSNSAIPFSSFLFDSVRAIFPLA